MLWIFWNTRLFYHLNQNNRPFNVFCTQSCNAVLWGCHVAVVDSEKIYYILLTYAARAFERASIDVEDIYKLNELDVDFCINHFLIYTSLTKTFHHTFCHINHHLIRNLAFYPVNQLEPQRNSGIEWEDSGHCEKFACYWNYFSFNR